MSIFHCEFEFSQPARCSANLLRLLLCFCFSCGDGDRKRFVQPNLAKHRTEYAWKISAQFVKKRGKNIINILTLSNLSSINVQVFLPFVFPLFLYFLTAKFKNSFKYPLDTLIVPSGELLIP